MARLVYSVERSVHRPDRVVISDGTREVVFQNGVFVEERAAGLKEFNFLLVDAITYLKYLPDEQDSGVPIINELAVQEGHTMVKRGVPLEEEASVLYWLSGLQGFLFAGSREGLVQQSGGRVRRYIQYIYVYMEGKCPK